MNMQMDLFEPDAPPDPAVIARLKASMMRRRCYHPGVRKGVGHYFWSLAHEGEFKGMWVHAFPGCYKPRHLTKQEIP